MLASSGLLKAHDLPVPGACRRFWCARSDGGLLAGNAMGAALIPGVRVLPGPGTPAGHQTLPTEAATAAGPTPLPGASHPLVLRAPEGRWEGRGHRRVCREKPADAEVTAAFPLSRPSVLHVPPRSAVTLRTFSLL